MATPDIYFKHGAVSILFSAPSRGAPSLRHTTSYYYIRRLYAATAWRPHRCTALFGAAMVPTWRQIRRLLLMGNAGLHAAKHATPLRRRGVRNSAFIASR